jgi:2-polyprenyl-3-methyl-5-hydroxy-6-metoxy-1,4-benzoquinol methylase
MADHVCPVWVGHLLASPLRRLLQDPARILSPHVREGMTALDAGCAMGFFSLPLARLVGPAGRVICVDLQQEMLDALARRASKAGLLSRLEPRRCESGDLRVADLAGTADFALAFAMIHETPDPESTIRQLAATLRPGGRLLVAEPRGHVGEDLFAETLASALAAGLIEIDRPPIRRSRAALFHRP